MINCVYIVAHTINKVTFKTEGGNPVSRARCSAGGLSVAIY